MRIWKHLRPTLTLAALALVVSPAHADRYGDIGDAAMAAFANNEFDKSIALCDPVVSAPETPHNAVIRCRNIQGWVQYRLGRYDDAIENLTAVIKAEPRNPFYESTYYALALSLGNAGRYDDAVHYFNRKSGAFPLIGLDLAARSSSYYLLGLYDAALADLKRYAGTVPADEQDNDALENLAGAQLMTGNPAAARKTIQRLQDAGDPDAPYRLARIELVDGNADAARALVEGRAQLGVSYKKDDMTVTETAPGSPAAQAGLIAGDILVAYGGQSISGSDQFQRLMVGSPPGQAVPITVERDGGRRILTIVPRGFEFSEDGLRGDLRYARFWHGKAAHAGAEKLLAAGDRRGALKVYADLTAKMPPNAEMISEIAALAKPLNPPPAPSADAQEFARQGESLARAAMDDEGFSAAVVPYRKAVRLAPWWPDAHLNLALLYEKRGDYALARHSFRNFLTLAGDAPEAAAVEAKMFEMEYLAKAD
jgi:tetratricopeptide (TPR) repeat protein